MVRTLLYVYGLNVAMVTFNFNLHLTTHITLHHHSHSRTCNKVCKQHTFQLAAWPVFLSPKMCRALLPPGIHDGAPTCNTLNEGERNSIASHCERAICFISTQPH